MRRRVGSWKYLAEDGRDRRLDLLRGYLIFAMVVDHIGEGSWLHAITGGDRFIVSAAEGFVFLSGLVMGMVYRRVIRRDGLRAALRKALGRGATLYVLHVVLTLGFVMASGLAGAFWFTPVLDDVGYVLDVLTLRQTYYLTDVIHLYALLVLATPPVLLLLARGRTLLVLLGSGLLWIAYQRYPWELSGITGNLAFPAAAWQLLFVCGIVLGYHRVRLERLLGRLPPIAVASILVTSIAAALVLLAQHLSGNTLFLTDGWAGQSYSDLFFKWDVRPGRLLAAAVFFPLAYLLVTNAWRPLVVGLGWFLLPLGQNSLLAYSAHLPVALMVATILSELGLEGDYPAVNTAAQLAGVALVWGVVKARELVSGDSTRLSRSPHPRPRAVATRDLSEPGSPRRRVPRLLKCPSASTHPAEPRRQPSRRTLRRPARLATGQLLRRKCTARPPW